MYKRSRVNTHQNIANDTTDKIFPSAVILHIHQYRGRIMQGKTGMLQKNSIVQADGRSPQA